MRHWDNENQLTAVETRTNVTGMTRTRCEYTYDAQSRRIAKKSLTGWTGTSYSTTNTSLFVYDGWLLLSELQVSGLNLQVLTNSYTWGLDLSGSLQGAGGVGGLLFAQLNNPATSNATTVFYCHDGNGNVTDLVDANDRIAAHYEYSPFGETLVATGRMAEANRMRFSTKYWDHETGLGYWGYRYYNPETGRWIGRDPMEEEGGLNLYVMSGGDPVNFADLLGLIVRANDYKGTEYDAAEEDNRFDGLTPRTLTSCLRPTEFGKRKTMLDRWCSQKYKTVAVPTGATWQAKISKFYVTGTVYYSLRWAHIKWGVAVQEGNKKNAKYVSSGADANKWFRMPVAWVQVSGRYEFSCCSQVKSGGGKKGDQLENVLTPKEKYQSSDTGLYPVDAQAGHSTTLDQKDNYTYRQQVLALLSKGTFFTPGAKIATDPKFTANAFDLGTTFMPSGSPWIVEVLPVDYADARNLQSVTKHGTGTGRKWIVTVDETKLKDLEKADTW